MELTTWANGLARGRLAEVLPRRWAHVQGVMAQAEWVAPAFGNDGDLLMAAAVLHDIGYAPELAVTGFHPLDGARFLRGVDAPDRLVHLVAHHSAATLEAELRNLSAELAEFEDEQSPVRDALWFCDMTTTPDGGRTTLTDRAGEIQKRYGPDHLVSCFIRWAWPELLGAVERTEARLEAAGVTRQS